MVQSVRSKCQSSQKLKRQDHGNRGTPRRLTEQSSVSQDCVCDAQITLRPQEYKDTMGRQAREWNVHLTQSSEVHERRSVVTREIRP